MPVSGNRGARQIGRPTYYGAHVCGVGGGYILFGIWCFCFVSSPWCFRILGSSHQVIAQMRPRRHCRQMNSIGNCPFCRPWFRGRPTRKILSVRVEELKSSLTSCVWCHQEWADSSCGPDKGKELVIGWGCVCDPECIVLITLWQGLAEAPSDWCLDRPGST